MAPRPELLSLLAACREQFADDAPRLVVADWLEENGGDADRARAEAIRLQLAEESEGRIPHHRQRIHALLKGHRSAWLGPLAGVGDAPWLDRGLWHWKAPAPSALLPAQTQSEAFAWLGVVECSWEQDLRLLLDSPLAQVPGLHLEQPLLSEAYFRQLKGWKGMRSLCLDRVHAGNEGWQPLAGLDLPLDEFRLVTGPLRVDSQRLLAGLPVLAKLSRFALNHADLTNSGTHLSPAAWLERLTHLDLTNSQIPKIASLVVSERLETLLLGHAQVRAGDAERLFERLPHPGRLRRLSLASAGLQDGPLASILAAPLSGLRLLDLPYNALTGAGLACLAGSACAGSLEVLRLRSMQAGAEGGAAVARLPGGTMRVLDLEGSGLGPAGTAALAKWPGLPGLESLSLEEDGIGPAGARALAGCDLRKLRRLDLAGNAMGDAGLRALLDGGGLQGIEWLALHGNGLGDASASALAQAQGLDRLRYLSVGGHLSRITPKGRAALAERFGEALAG